MPKLDSRLVTTLTFVFHAVGALLVAYVFLAVLMTAAAQQRVIARLEDRNKSTAAATEGFEKLDYSAGRIRIELAEPAKTKLETLRPQAARLSLVAQQRTNEADEAAKELEKTWAPVGALVEEARKVCKFLAIGDMSRPNTFAVRQVRACATNNPGAAAILSRNAELFARFDTEQKALLAARFKAQGATSEDATKAEEIDDLQTKIKSAAELKGFFSEIDMLEEFPLSSWAAGFPPSVLQIVMAFVSGTFGALLVTLVLIVYPNNKISASAGTKNAARIFLGGLISMGVYILLNGGTALLGGNVAFDESKANYMTFCAVGVMAGMFSDRVALWLSDRADAFFTEHEEAAPPESSPEAGGKAEPAAAPHVYG